MFDFFHKKEKLPGEIKQSIKPGKEFTKQTKTTFLAVFGAANAGVQSVSARGLTMIAKSLIAVGALIAIFGGMSVYADTANVAADSPLYPLKRLDESVQLAVAPPAEKAQLQVTFAARRADEISDLETRHPSSTIIAGLASDLNTSLNASLDDAQNAKLGGGQLNNFCDKVLNAIATSSVDIRGNFGAEDAHTHLQIMNKFMAQCGTDLSQVGANNTSSISSTSSTPTASSSLRFRLFPPFVHSTSTSTTISGFTRATTTTTITTATTTRRGYPFYRLPGGINSTSSILPHL